MSICFPCGDCGQKYEVGDDLAGKKFSCRVCGAALSIPVPRRIPSAVAPASPQPRPARPKSVSHKRNPFEELDQGNAVASGDEQKHAYSSAAYSATYDRAGYRGNAPSNGPSGAAIAAVSGSTIVVILLIGLGAWAFRSIDWSGPAVNKGDRLADTRPDENRDDRNSPKPKLPKPAALAAEPPAGGDPVVGSKGPAPGYGPAENAGYPGANNGYPGSAGPTGNTPGYGPADSSSYTEKGSGYPGTEGPNAKSPGYGPSDGGGYTEKGSGYPGTEGPSAKSPGYGPSDGGGQNYGGANYPGNAGPNAKTPGYGPSAGGVQNAGGAVESGNGDSDPKALDSANASRLDGKRCARRWAKTVSDGWIC